MTTTATALPVAVRASAADGRNLLTYSRLRCAKTCLRKHQWQYEVGIRRERKSEPLRIGLAVHLGIEHLACGQPLSHAVAAIEQAYKDVPEWIEDPSDWRTEEQIVIRLVCGYHWRWGECEGGLFGGEVIATEQSFVMPIIGSHGRPTPTFRVGGKYDNIIRLLDSRLAVMERKTTSQSIEPDSDFWRRLRLDHQITLYMLGARHKGHDVQTVIYDAIHKPGMGRKQVPVLADGCKVVLDADGQRVYNQSGSPRQSADKAKGWILQTRLETPAEFGGRLNEDIGKRPDFYYARREIPRLESDLDDFRAELWQTQKLLRDCQRHGRWFRNTDACLSPYKCEFFGPCVEGQLPEDGPPNGYCQLDWVHPELEELCNGSDTNSTTGAADSTAERI